MTIAFSRESMGHGPPMLQSVVVTPSANWPHCLSVTRLRLGSMAPSNAPRVTVICSRWRVWIVDGSVLKQLDATGRGCADLGLLPPVHITPWRTCRYSSTGHAASIAHGNFKLGGIEIAREACELPDLEMPKTWQGGDHEVEATLDVRGDMNHARLAILRAHVPIRAPPGWRQGEQGSRAGHRPGIRGSIETQRRTWSSEMFAKVSSSSSGNQSPSFWNVDRTSTTCTSHQTMQ